MRVKGLVNDIYSGRNLHLGNLRYVDLAERMMFENFDKGNLFWKKLEIWKN
jgi:hypothetical protein